MVKQSTITQQMLEKLSLTELDDVATLVETVTEAKRTEEVAKLRSDIEARAKAFGIDPVALFKKARKPVVVKFRNANGDTWTGRGRKPTWMSGLAEKEVEKLRV